MIPVASLDRHAIGGLIAAADLGPPLPFAAPQIGTQTYQNPNVVEACTTENRLETLENLSERLDATQKSLSNYLDTKRNAFPRFFFISDDELLSVLGSSDPTSIQVCGEKKECDCSASWSPVP